MSNTTNEIKTHNWMRALNGRLSLKDIAIPGTHDSAAWKLQRKLFAPWMLTQDHDFERQLNDGIRFFDLRLDVSMNLYHGDFYLLQDFETLMHIYKNFLDKYKSETVIASIKLELLAKGETWHDFDRIIRERYIEHPDWRGLFYTGTHVPALYEVRGKIVLFRRFESEQQLGINAEPRLWQDNALFTFEDSKGLRIKVQDCYSSDDKILRNRVSWKVKYIVDMLDEARDRHDCMYINFLSHCAKRFASTRKHAAAIYKSITDRKRLSELYIKRHPGVYLFDYYNVAIVDAIISTNFADA